MKAILVTFIFVVGLGHAFGQVSTLPIELYYFNYQLTDTSVHLTWETLTEENNYGFFVQRYSNTVWDSLGFVFGNGNSNSPKYYNFNDTTIQKGQTYLYRLKQQDLDGSIKYSDTLTVSTVAGVKIIKKTIPDKFTVSQNYPNPFNPSTNIRVDISKAGELTLKIFDSLGRMVDLKNYGYKLPGIYLINYNAVRLSSGIYFYTVETGRNIQTKPMILLK